MECIGMAEGAAIEDNSGLTAAGTVAIICLTREPKASVNLAAGKHTSTKSSALVVRRRALLFTL